MLFNRKSPQAATEAVRHAGAGAANESARSSAGIVTRDKRVTDIPASLIRSHADFKPAGQWSGLFDLAVWLRLPQGTEQSLSLVLRYTDQRGEHSVPVDRCGPGAFKSALLNGSIQLDINGRVKQMALYLRDVPSDLYIGLEEWHFLPQIRRKAS